MKPAGFSTPAMCAASGTLTWRAPGTFCASDAMRGGGPPRWSSAPLMNSAGARIFPSSSSMSRPRKALAQPTYPGTLVRRIIARTASSARGFAALNASENQRCTVGSTIGSMPFARTVAMSSCQSFANSGTMRARQQHAASRPMRSG